MDKSGMIVSGDSTAPPSTLANNAFYLIAGQAVSSVLAVILTAFLGRWLGVAEFGSLYLLLAISTFAYAVADWGHSAYLVREAARRHEDGDKLLSGALVFRVLAGLAVALATPLLLTLLGYDKRTVTLAALAVLCGLPLALSQTFVFMFRSRDRMDLDAAVTIAAKAVTVGLTIPVLVLGGGIAAVVFMAALGGLAGLALAAILAYRIGFRAVRPARPILRELAYGGAPIAVYFLALAAQPFVDAIVLSRLVPLEVIGWYGAARSLMGVLLTPGAILCNASFPELSRLSGSLAGFRQSLRTTLRLLLGVGGLGAAGTYLFAPVAVSLIYGQSDFAPAAAVLRMFAPVLFLYFVSSSFSIALTAIGKTTALAVTKALSVTLSAGLALILIPMFQTRYGNGGIGLVAAFGATEIIMLIAYFLLLPRGMVAAGALLDIARAGVAAGGTVMLFQLLPAMSPWFGIPASVMLFLVLALILGLTTRTDLSALSNLLKGKLWSRRKSMSS